MARKKRTSKVLDWKAVLGEQEDFLRPLIQEVVQEVLEGEMTEALQAAKSERTTAVTISIYSAAMRSPRRGIFA